jgi:CheY-like chemotaxis protein
MRGSVLIVDDNEQDLELATLALERLGIAQAVVTAGSGEAAMNYLLSDETGCCPSVILLDIRMPKMDGHEVLAELKRHPRLRQIPVVMFSASALQSDIDRSYSLGAAGYAVKPLQFHLLVQTLEHVVGFWVRTNRLPSGSLAHVHPPG